MNNTRDLAEKIFVQRYNSIRNSMLETRTKEKLDKLVADLAEDSINSAIIFDRVYNLITTKDK